MAKVNTNKEIAYKLGIYERTDKVYLTSIYVKFGVDAHAFTMAI